MIKLPNQTNRNNSIEQEIEAKQRNKNLEKQTGYGDKKLEGPNRPQD